MVPAVRVSVFARLAGVIAVLCAALSPAVAHASSTRILRPGARGPAVRALQDELDQAGFVVQGTGVFDAATTRAVRSFERRYGLAVNGVATAPFIRALQRIRSYDLAAVDAPLTGPLTRETSDATSVPAGSGGGGLGTGTTTTTTTPTGTTGTTTTGTTTTGTTTTGTGTTTENGTETNAPNLPNRRYGSRTLHMGLEGTDVENLQNYLTLAGYKTSVDGDFGPKTRHSVESYQRAKGMSANGVVSRSEQMSLQRNVATATTTSDSGGQATLNADGTVTAPAGAPLAVTEAIAAANSIIDDPYIYGGGHASFTDTGYDCSGSVSFALHGGGLLSTPEDSTQLETYGDAGPGRWITIYANPVHAFVVIAGLAFDTAHYGPTFPSGTGPRWLQPADVIANLSDGTGGYVVRHPAGL